MSNDDEVYKTCAGIVVLIAIALLYGLLFGSGTTERTDETKKTNTTSKNRISDGYNYEDGAWTTSDIEDYWGCTTDCSGHEAGYQWAEEHGIDDPSNCGGKSDSFIEGCESYAEMQQSVY